ncbi:hypothetical protein SLEP1_g58434 [Rubroshorea leprosula]|uniref:Cytochrome P450 n=1 Tax=Rubroshorea leprosula TaxID=152421 RepID=A0AAV5MQG7_9ROSI|nr:hypothetical protein SLEP1_g58434 [Rubroshorea leprosula]
MVVKVMNRWKTKNRKLPPGPWRLPLIGNVHQLVGSLPHHILRDLAKKHGPLMHLQLGEISSIVVSSPEIAREVLITNGIIFAQRPHMIVLNTITYNSRDLAFAPYGSYWRHLRKICTVELLTTKRVQSFRSIREEEVSALVKAIALNDRSPINLSEKIFSLTYGITSRAAFGSKCKDQDAYISIVKAIVEMSTGFSLAEMYPSMKVLQVFSGTKRKLENLFQESDRILTGILDEHREEIKVEKGQAREDLVTSLLKLQENGGLEFPLTDTDIKAVILDIFNAGSETSSTIVDWAMAEMIKNPKVLEKAQKEVRRVFDKQGDVDEAGIHELRYLTTVIKETLRLHPSLPLLFPRISREKCEIKGYQIPEKTQVIISAWAIARDPEYWSEAERFVPEKFLDSSLDFRGTDLEFIPFGAGRRACPGISFALPNIELPLAKLLYHFDWKLPNGMKGEDLDMSEAFGLTVRRKDDLILVPTTY